MLKAIFRQLLNRKRSNLWILLELLAVFCLIWYIVDYFFVLNYNYCLPNHRDINHTWQVNIEQYPPEHPNYKAEENEEETKRTNYRRILQKLQNYSKIEAVSVVAQGATPNSGSYWGSVYTPLNDTTRSVGGQKIAVDSQYDFFRVFGYTSDKGKKKVSIQDFDWNVPHAAVISRSVAELLFPNTSPVGQEIGNKALMDMKVDFAETYRIVGIVDNIKRFDYERPQNAFYVAERLELDKTWLNPEISIRSASSMSDAVFHETFKKEMTNALQVGNFYFRSLISYKQIQATTNNDMTGNIRIRTSLMVFFLVNILLCVIGAFWYRVNLRREETGIRLTFGSSRKGIRNILFLEGLCLLTIAALPAMLIELQFVHADLIDTLGKGRQNIPENYLPDNTELRFLITNCITWLIIAIIIIGAIWLPARKATTMTPAEALRYE